MLLEAKCVNCGYIVLTCDNPYMTFVCPKCGGTTYRTEEF